MGEFVSCRQNRSSAISRYKFIFKFIKFFYTPFHANWQTLWKSWSFFSCLIIADIDHFKKDPFQILSLLLWQIPRSFVKIAQFFLPIGRKIHPQKHRTLFLFGGCLWIEVHSGFWIHWRMTPN